VLEKLAGRVETDIHNASFVSLRSDVRNYLKELRKQAERFDKALSRIFKYYHHLPVKEFTDLPDVRQPVKALMEFCDNSLSVVSDKGGREKEPGRIICAMIVIEAWSFAKGKAPCANNHTVHTICDEYWRACGYQSLGDPRNWRTSMVDALRNDSGERRLVQNEIQGMK
jgi:hypothetical protein